MSVISMTGFGEASAVRGGITVHVEISSINRKQLDLSVNLPRSLQSLEVQLTGMVKQAVTRGRVAVTVQVSGSKGSSVAALSFNEPLAKSFLQSCRQSARILKLQGDLSISDLLRIPGVVVIEEAGADVAKVEPLLKKAAASALRDMLAAREREGKSLARDLTRRLGLMGKAVASLKRRAPRSVADHRAALAKRIAALAPSVTMDPDRLEREVVLFADRSDVTEELTRLDSHLDQALVIMKGDGPSGKSLDFLAQEMLREINTIGSKSSDRVMAHAVVSLKTELERFREQVQNIE